MAAVWDITSNHHQRRCVTSFVGDKALCSSNWMTILCVLACQTRDPFCWVGENGRDTGGCPMGDGEFVISNDLH